jgi:hypothetical protein
MKRKTSAEKMSVAALQKAINVHKKEIGKHRDALRDLLDDANAVLESSSDAIEDLQRATDRLSEYL